MTTISCDVAIIGAGTAGLHAYKSAAKAGANVLLIEQGPGGSTCTATGCIPSKLLIAAGRAAAQAHKAHTFGVDVADVVIDGAAVMRRVQRERDKSNGQIRDEYLAIPETDRLHGKGRFMSSNRLIVGEDIVEARAVIVATGGYPKVPEALEPIQAVVHTHETIFDIPDLPASIAVIGAGPLGLELAQAFSRLGVKVTVLDHAEAVGALKDPACEHVARAALSQTMTIALGVEISAAMEGKQARLTWTGGHSGEAIVDMVLAATGRAPQLDGLDLDVMGVETDEDGVPVFDPDTRRCGDGPIFLAGDVDAWRPVLHEAARGGTIAGHVAAGGDAFPPIPALSIAFTEPNLVEIGAKYGSLPDGAIVGVAEAHDNARSGIDADDEGLVHLYADARGTLLGGTIILTGGEHLGQSLALAIDRGMTAAEFADQTWYHPVLEEMLQAAARDIVRQAGGA